MQTCQTSTVNVIANDTDPEGNYPLSLVSITDASFGMATILDGATISYQAARFPGSDTITYTVQDSLGATSTGTLSVSISRGATNCTVGP